MLIFVLKQAAFIFSKVVNQKSAFTAGSSSAYILTARSQCAFLQLIYELRWVLWFLLELTLWNSRLNKRHRIINTLSDWIPRHIKGLDLFAVLLGSYPSNAVYLRSVWPHKQTLSETVVWSHFTKCFRIVFWHFSEYEGGACLLMTHCLVEIGNIKLSREARTLLDSYDGIWGCNKPHLGVFIWCSRQQEWHNTQGEPSVNQHQTFHESITDTLTSKTSPDFVLVSDFMCRAVL